MRGKPCVTVIQMRQTFIALASVSLISLCSLAAQTKLPPTPAEYGQWETLVAPGGGGRGGGASTGGLSPDGKWLAYGINRSNGNNELRVTNLAAATTKVTAFGTQQAFSSDSEWLAFSIGYSEAQSDKMRKDNKPVENKLGLMNLKTGEQTVIDAIQSFTFSPEGKWLAMRHYPPETGGAGGGRGAAAAGVGGGGRGGGRGGASNGADDSTPGATLIVRELASGRDMTFGNVSEFAWQDVKKQGTLLAIAISTPDKTGNGFNCSIPRRALCVCWILRQLLTATLRGGRIPHNLPPLRSKTDDKREGATYMAMAWSDLAAKDVSKPAIYDPTADKQFPAEKRTVTFGVRHGQRMARSFSWVFRTGIRKRRRRAGRGGRGGGAATDDAASEPDDQPAVDVWHWRDPEVMAYQVKNATQDGRRNTLAAWHIDTGNLTQLGQGVTEQVTPLKHGTLAYVQEWKDFTLERSIGRPVADIYLADLTTGKRTKVKEKLSEDRYLQASPGGHYLLYLENDQYWTIDVNTHMPVNITKKIKTSFTDLESDATVKQKPPFGLAGWTKTDREVILYDKYDLWKVAADGSSAVRLTNGAAEQVRNRYVRLDAEEDAIDLDKPMYLSLFGIWTKKSGYAVLRPGAPAPERLLWADKSIERLAKAADAPVFEYTSETFEDSPNIMVGGPELKDAKRVTDTNPFQDKYAWSRSELVDYQLANGTHLQGSLYYPAGYEAGKKYPMVVYMYEKLSDGLHHYNAPSERSYYSASAFTSHGYFLLEPDIVFKKREPGLSVAECVTAAVKKVLAKGIVDDKKVGIIGHSWGGFDAAFLATHTHIFAAAVAGAPITDLISNYGNHHWSSGIAETDHIETGQQRMEVPLYEDLQAYIPEFSSLRRRNNDHAALD